MVPRLNKTLLRAPVVATLWLLSSSSARAEGPDQVAARSACEAALKSEAQGNASAPTRAACYDSPQLGMLAEDFRNKTATLMSPRVQPSFDDLVAAALNADAAVHKADSQVWGYLARCDIARKLGSAQLLATCLADLARIAPADPATVQARRYATERTSMGIWILRLLLLVVLVGTVADALRRRRQVTRPGSIAAARSVSGTGLALFVLLSFVAGTASAEGLDKNDPNAKLDMPKGDLSQYKLDDNDPEGSLPKDADIAKNPLQLGYFIQDLLDHASRAEKAGNLASEVRYFRALTKVAPNEAYAPRKACEIYEKMGDIPNAIIACRTVLGRPGLTVGDSVHFVNLVLSTKGKLPEVERTELNAVIDHVSQQGTQLGSVPATLRCEVALRFNDYTTLESCTSELTKLAPDDPRTVSLKWALALEKHDRSNALALIQQARRIGMSNDGIAQMERATRRMTMRRVGMVTFLALALAAGLALVFLRVRRDSAQRRLAV